MRAIWKFPLSREWRVPGGGKYQLPMPFDSVVRHVDTQDGEAVIWAEVPNTDAPLGLRTFYVTCTGDPIPDETAHVGSYVERDEYGHEYVYHVFEKACACCLKEVR